MCVVVGMRGRSETATSAVLAISIKSATTAEPVGSEPAPCRSKENFRRRRLHNDGVHCAFHIGEQAACGDKRRMDAKFDAVIGVLGDAEQLDAVAEFFGKLNVFGFQM